MIKFKDVADQIAKFREEALDKKNIRAHDSYDQFYQILFRHCYSHGEKNGIFYNIIQLLYNLLNELKLEDKNHFTFWLNYNPRCITANEKLGRLINPNEYAYYTAEGRDIQILTSDNKTDAIVYYFQQIMGNNIGAKHVMSIQEALNSTNNEIDVMSMSYCSSSDEIIWHIRDNNAEEKCERISALTTPIFTGEYCVEKQETYDYFLRKTFNVAVKSQMNFGDEFDWSDASYTPTCFYVCNLSLPYTSSQNYRGSIMFASNAVISLSEISNVLNKLKGLIELLIAVEVDFKECLDKSIIKSESLKSAKAAIMSRNMSHNLGSHVMFYIKQKLQSVSKIVDSKVLDNIIPGNVTDIAEVVARIKENKDIELPFLVGLGRFINYLQERQDYIATIATDYIPANSTISFKDFIYDELKPDLRYRRHHVDNPDGEAGWAPGNLLLDYIAYSEGYRSSNEIIIKFKDFNGENPKENGEESEDFQELRKFNVAVPGGVLGRQAIFSIFENIIRNAAKHSKRRDDNKMVLQLSLLDIDKDKSIFEDSKNFCSKLYDDSSKSIKSIDNLSDLCKNTSSKYHFLRIKLDMPNSDEGVEKLIDNLADPYLEDNGSMKETAKGLKEMRISAAWLRNYSIDTEIDVSKEPPALSVYTEKYCKDSIGLKTISYILCIPKPSRVAFVVEQVSEDYAILNKQLESLGCKIYGHDDDVKSDVALFCKRTDGENIINSAIPNYEIICFLTDLNVEDEVYQQISSRYINNHKITEEILKRLKDCKGDIDKLRSEIDTIYEVWYNEWFKFAYPNCNGRKITILDDKVHDEYIAAQNKANIKEKFPILDDDKSQRAVLVDSTGNITQEYCTDTVVYKTHFKGMRNESKDSYLAGANFIESITGNNSTARIIRQDKWNKLWKYKLLFSGHAKVAIFDERIYDTFIATRGMVESKKVYDLLANESKSKEDVVSCLQEQGFTEDESYAIVYQDDGYEEFINSKCKEYNIDVAQQNHERRTWAFNVKIEHNSVVIMGYNVPIDNNVGNFVLATSPEIRVAKIKQEGDGYSVELCDKGQVFLGGEANVFDFITIHLGILDKIYNAFGVKGNEKEMLKITNALHKCFAKAKTPADYKEFLPNFIIHSGRSKPSKKDMPQKQPFVPFAAVDYAVKDCKYTLVELLTTAHYE